MTSQEILSQAEQLPEPIDPYSKRSIALLSKILTTLKNESDEIKNKLLHHNKIRNLFKSILSKEGMPEPWVGKHPVLEDDDIRLYQTFQFLTKDSGEFLFKARGYIDFVYLLLQGEVRMLSAEFVIKESTDQKKEEEEEQTFLYTGSVDHPMVLQILGKGKLIGEVSAAYKGVR